MQAICVICLWNNQRVCQRENEGKTDEEQQKHRQMEVGAGGGVFAVSGNMSLCCEESMIFTVLQCVSG